MVNRRYFMRIVAGASASLLRWGAPAYYCTRFRTADGVRWFCEWWQLPSGQIVRQTFKRINKW